MADVLDQNLDARGVAEVIVSLQQNAGAAGAPEYERLAGHFIDSELSLDSAILSALPRRRARAPRFRVYRHLGLMLGTVDRAGVNALRRDGSVEHVVAAPEISLVRPAGYAAASGSPQTTWGVARLRVPEAWQRGFTGKNVLVAHLDTGVDAKHPALTGAISKFAEFDELGNKVSGAKPRESNAAIPHGTHTAGTIAGRTFKKWRFGVAPGARLASAIVIEGGNIAARVLAGLDWAAGLNARVLCMSLGLRGYREEFSVVMRAIRRAGMLPVVAAGNEGPGTSRSPGNYASVLSVGACNAKDRVWADSSSQRFTRADDPLVPDLVGPGESVVSAAPGGKVAQMAGTSMATPHIAGLAALLFEAAPTATVDAVEKAILASCKRPSSMPATRANRGLPDAIRALDALAHP